MNNIMKTEGTTGSFPSAFALPGLFVESMEPSFSTAGDAMPTQGLGWDRTKYIHSVGAVGKVKFVPIKNSPYTGIF